ncbi:uncharacterized protein ACIBXB_018004 [Morphnus guianensis]
MGHPAQGNVSSTDSDVSCRRTRTWKSGKNPADLALPGCGMPNPQAGPEEVCGETGSCHQHVEEALSCCVCCKGSWGWRTIRAAAPWMPPPWSQVMDGLWYRFRITPPASSSQLLLPVHSPAGI